MDYKEWVSIGERMGLKEAELRAFVDKKETEYLEREERAFRREDEKKRYEEEKKKYEEERMKTA